jgi:hypothetical protein
MDAAESKSDLAGVWRQRITAQQSAGESIRGWCKAHSCQEHAFYWWRARLGLSRKSVLKRRRPALRPKFAEVVVDSAPRVGQSMTLRLSGGAELVLPVMAVGQIAELVRAIAGGK